MIDLLIRALVMLAILVAVRLWRDITVGRQNFVKRQRDPRDRPLR